jgi:hypothetical protein
VSDTIASESGQCGTLGRNLGAIDEPHAIQLEGLPFHATQVLEAHEPLLGEQHRGIGLSIIAAK